MPRHRHLTPTLAVLALFILSFPTGCKTKAKTPDTAAEGSAGTQALAIPIQSLLGKYDWNAIPDPYQGGEVIAHLDDVSVTREELSRFHTRILGDMSAGHASIDFEDSELVVLPSYVRYFAVAREGEKVGVQNDPRFTDRMNITLLSLMAGQYKDFIEANAPIPAAEISRLIPSRWVKINFAVKVFSSEERAREALGRIKSPEDFRAEPGDVSPGKRELPQTGLVFPGSGFFDPFEESALFDLEKDAVHGPVSTGLGAALVMVLDRLDMGPEEQNEYLAAEREKLTAAYVSEKLSEAILRYNRKIDKEALERAMVREGSGLGFSDETVAEIEGRKISYRLFRLLKGISYDYIWDNFPPSSWFNMVYSDLARILDQLAFGLAGLEAAGEGTWSEPLEPRLIKILYDYRKTYLYYGLLDTIKDRLVSETSEEENEGYYRENLMIFKRPPSVEILYDYTPDEKIYRQWLGAIEEGGGFDEAASLTKDQGAAHASVRGVRRIRVVKNERDFEWLQDRLFGGVKAGDFFATEGEMGYYLVRILKVEEEKVLPFEEVKFQAAELNVLSRLRPEIEATVRQLASAVKVRTYRDEPGDPDLPPPVRRTDDRDLG